MRNGICCALAAAAASIVAGSANAALVHRYTFNDGTTTDSVGAAHGVAVRGPAIQNGQVVFDPAVNTGINTNPATGQYVDLPNNIARFRNLTVEAWFTWRGGNAWQRVFDFGNNAQKTDVTPFDTTGGHTGRGFIMYATRNNPGTSVAQISIDSHGDPGDTDFSATGSPLPTGVEHHLVFAHDRDGGAQRLYLNGQLVGQDAATVDPSVTNYLNSWLGRSQFAADPFFNGSINELRIYDNALPAAAVQSNFASGPNGAIAVPEPTAAAAAVGLLGLAGLARRRGRHRVRSGRAKMTA